MIYDVLDIFILLGLGGAISLLRDGGERGAD